MLRSMTGFGKAEGNAGNKKFTAELKSLNSKQLDLNLRMPSAYREHELELRSWLSENLQRGKSDLLIYYESLEPEKRMSINKPLMAAYYADLKDVADSAGMTGSDFLNALIRIPDVMKPENTEVDETEWKQLLNIIKEAYSKFDQYRQSEGSKLADDFKLRINLILQYRNELEAPIALRNQKVREKIKSNIDELIPPDKVDQNRFEQELIYYMERLDISEEQQRLHTNCMHFMEELECEASGKKLGFISQEIGREINTIGSKANDADMQKLVVKMKDELEKVKEQINNVL
ncbi:MAG: YicC/YloC family endoribonuclease [Flavobacteriales bacterium]